MFQACLRSARSRVTAHVRMDDHSLWQCPAVRITCLLDSSSMLMWWCHLQSEVRAGNGWRLAGFACSSLFVALWYFAEDLTAPKWMSLSGRSDFVLSLKLIMMVAASFSSASASFAQGSLASRCHWPSHVVAATSSCGRSIVWVSLRLPSLTLGGSHLIGSRPLWDFSGAGFFHITLVLDGRRPNNRSEPS